MNAEKQSGPARESKTDQAYRLLEEKIVTMALAPGMLVSEAEVALELGLGRTPVREALQRLAVEHLVEIMPRRGIRVAEINVAKQLRLLEVRRVLETLAVGLAARRASPAVRADFAELAERMETAGSDSDYLAFLRLDRDFDALVLDAAGNEFTAAILQQLHGLSRRFWHHYYRREEDLQLVTRLHSAIARAVSAGDEAAAVSAASAHMDYIYSFTRAVLEY
ncbi:MAG: GntR family transcriptional regulator [Parahaliea sp.]